MINLQEFLDWYKKAEVELWDKKWIFREPKMKDINLSFSEMLKTYCLEWDAEEFIKILNEEIPSSLQKEVVEKILNELGLA